MCLDSFLHQKPPNTESQETKDFFNNDSSEDECYPYVSGRKKKLTSESNGDDSNKDYKLDF